MRKTLTGIPDHKREELKKIVRQIRLHIGSHVQMIILFGSFARGDWVEDRYVEDHILYEYKSDFDIMVLVDDEDIENDFKRWSKLNSAIACNKEILTPAGILTETIEFFNEQVEIGRYFYADLVKEGVLLHDSGKYKIAKPRELTVEEALGLAQEDFEMWFTKSNDFIKTFKFHLEGDMSNLAAFDLHQATEGLFVTNLLVYTSYRPKTHSLKKLYKTVMKIDSEFEKIFPQTTEVDKNLFTRLDKAYVDARYKKGYEITRDELEALFEKVERLQKLTEKVCTQRLKFLEKKAKEKQE